MTEGRMKGTLSISSDLKRKGKCRQAGRVLEGSFTVEEDEKPSENISTKRMYRIRHQLMGQKCPTNNRSGTHVLDRNGSISFVPKTSSYECIGKISHR